MSIPLQTAEVETSSASEYIPLSTHHTPALLEVDQVIALLFPAPTLGQLFYIRFRERASREQTILPDEPADVVVACTKSIATLAQDLEIGFDTTQKYVALYKALGLMKKRKLMGKIAFVIPVGIYHPPDLLEANLQHLLKRIKGRHKLRELVGDVLARCKVYGLINQDFQAAAALLQNLLQPQPGETRRTLEQRLLQAGQVFGQVLSSMQNLPKARGREDAEWFRPPGTVEAAESTQSVRAGRSDDSRFDRNLPQSAHRVDSAPSQSAEESTHPLTQSRFEGEAPTENLPDGPNEVDSPRSHTAEESIHPLTQGRFEGKALTRNLSRLPHQVDSSLAGSNTHATESTQPDEKSRFGQETALSNLPDPTVRVDSSPLVNVNVITLINTITLNVKPVATFCCNALGEPPSKQPVYLKLFRDCERDARAISAAFLFTLVHRRDGTMHNPAAVFVTRCRDYHKQGVPDEVAALVRQYGSLTYAQLLDALSKPASFTPPARGAPSPAGSGYPPAPVTPASLSPLPRWGTIQRFIGVEDDRPGMSRETALQVIRLAQGDRRTKMCHVDLEPLADGYAVLLDNTITAIPRQTYFYSLQDWQTRTAAIQDCFELFGVARTGRRYLADMLQERRAAQ
ncbi:MAG: hypothetical protein ACRDIV_17480 [Ktedonobacteraceae bacterium]